MYLQTVILQSEKQSSINLEYLQLKSSIESKYSLSIDAEPEKVSSLAISHLAVLIW